MTGSKSTNKYLTKNEKTTNGKWKFVDWNIANGSFPKPFQNHAANHKEIEVKELYFSILALLVKDSEKINGVDSQYLKALCAGLKLPDYHQWIVKGIHVAEENLSYCLERINHEGLGHWLVLDALLLYKIDDLLGEGGEEVAEILGSICDLLGLSDTMVQSLSDLSRAINEEDITILEDAAKNLDNSFPFKEVCECYMCKWLRKIPKFHVQINPSIQKNTASIQTKPHNNKSFQSEEREMEEMLSMYGETKPQNNNSFQGQVAPKKNSDKSKADQYESDIADDYDDDDDDDNDPFAPLGRLIGGIFDFFS